MVAFVMPAACADILGVDVLPVGPLDAGRTDDAGPPPDHTSDTGSKDGEDAQCGPSLPAQVTFSGHPASAAELDLKFTKGPSYMLKRRVTHAPDAQGEDTFAVIAPTLPACTSSYHDDGQSGGYGTAEDGGLEWNWQYTYELQVLLPDGGVDPSFPAAALTLQTWSSPTEPSMDDASVTVTADGG
jgi:hypothetical protein